MIKQLAAQLEQLKMAVKSKTAVPTSQVFVSTWHPLPPRFCGPGSQYIALTGLELALETRLASNHKDSLASLPECWEGGRDGGRE